MGSLNSRSENAFRISSHGVSHTANSPEISGFLSTSATASDPAVSMDANRAVFSMTSGRLTSIHWPNAISRSLDAKKSASYPRTPTIEFGGRCSDKSFAAISPTRNCQPKQAKYSPYLEACRSGHCLSTRALYPLLQQQYGHRRQSRYRLVTK